MADRLFISNSDEAVRFIKKLLLFILVAAVIDRSLGYCLDYILRNKVVHSGNFGAINSAVKEKAGIIIMGDSRAKHNYVPRIISKDMRSDCFNLGADGMGVNYDYSLLTHILSNYKPGLIIYELNLELNGNKPATLNYYKLMPFIKRYDNLVRLVKEKDAFIELKLLSGAYPFNKKIHSLIYDSMFAARNDDLKGYQPLYGTKLENEFKEFTIRAQPTVITESPEISKSTFSDFIELAGKHDVPVLFVYSPMIGNSGSYTIDPASLKRYSEMITSHGMKLILLEKQDYPQLGDKSLFWDPIHLNDEGAKVFSEIINRRLAELKKENYFRDSPPGS